MFPRLRSLGHALFRRARYERELSDEMRFHMSVYADDLMRSGLTRAQAERRARVEFGAIDSFQEECRQARGLRFFDELRQDLSYAARQLRKAPAFTVAAVLSLGLGIGANTAIFSLMDAVLFRTLPLANPNSLYFLAHSAGTDTSISANYPLLPRYQALDVFSGVAAYTQHTFAVAAAEGSERVNGQYVSGNFHALLGVPLLRGRGFSDEPDQPTQHAPIAVISDAYWQRKFARRDDIIGQRLIIDGRDVTIAGVTAPSFHALDPGSAIDITLPMSVKALDEPQYLSARDGWISLTLVGRIQPGVTVAQAQEAMNTVFQRFWEEPDNAWARDEQKHSAVLLAAAKGTDGLQREYRNPLRVLMSMVAIVLLIACANVANLLLARGTVRAREVGVRLSIGAGRARLVRQFLTESLLLAGAGGLLGLLMAVLVTRAILSLFNVGEYPTLLDASLNLRVLGFASVACLLTGIAFGLVPALKATRVDLAAMLKEGNTRTHTPRLSGGKALVVAQISLCLLVTAGAALLSRSLRNLKTLDAGFARENVVLFNLQTGVSLPDAQRWSFYDAVLGRVRGLPGVLSAAYSERSPIDFSEQRRRIDIPGFTDLPRGGVSSNAVTPDFFRSFGIALKRGRMLSEQDRAGAQAVMLVSEAMAREYFKSTDPIGRIVVLGGNRTRMSVVGVVADVRHERLRDAPPPMVYPALAQPAEAFDGSMGYAAHLTVIVRTSSSAPAFAASARKLVKDLRSDATITYVRTMDQQLDAALVRERLLSTLSSGFGLLAVLLAFVGLYGLLSYSVAQRMPEIAIRVALGATSTGVLWRVLRESLLLSVLGISIGLVAALLAGKLVATFLFQLSPRDPLTLAGVAVALLLVALLAGLFPALRAARVPSINALSR